MRLWPPASSFESGPSSPSRSIASSTERAATYPKRGGIIGQPSPCASIRGLPVGDVPHHALVVRITEGAADVVARHNEVREIVERPYADELRHPTVQRHRRVAHRGRLQRLHDRRLEPIHFGVVEAAAIRSLVAVLGRRRVIAGEYEVLRVD